MIYKISVKQVFDGVAAWQDVFASTGVPAGDIARFSEIDDHLAK